MAFIGAAFNSVRGRGGLSSAVRRRRSVKMCAGEKPSTVQFAMPDKAREALAAVGENFPGGVSAMNERFGQACAMAISETFPPSVNGSGIIMCGPGQNGTVGFYTGVQLQKLGYDITILACRSNKDFTEDDVRKAGMSFIDFMPGPIGAIYNFFVDAMLGLEYNNGILEEPYRAIIGKIANSEKPTISIDVPTGWDLAKGPKDEDLWRGTVLKPDLLLSLGIPKMCSRRFGGAFHYVVADCVPEEVLSKAEVILPTYPKDSDIVLVGGNPALFGWGKNPGEIYGKEGAMMATLFPNLQTRRKWVDIDDDPALWDELD